MDPRGENLALQYFMQYFAGVSWESGAKIRCSRIPNCPESPEDLAGGRGADIGALTLSDYVGMQSKQNRRSCTLKQNLW
jgi:hypothetical protein